MARRPDRKGGGRLSSRAGAAPAQKAAAQTSHGTVRTIVEIVVIVAAAFVIALLVQAFLVKPFTIHQISMEPTLHEGDRVLINRLAYHFRDPAPGDIIVFESPVGTRDDLVKRVVAVAGDTVTVREGVLYVNGAAQQEPYLAESPFSGKHLPDVQLQEGTVFVMGDNRNNSGDSRLFGPISTESIVGVAFARYWPVSRWSGL